LVNSVSQEKATVKAFVVGFILGLIVVPLAVYVYFNSGSAPIATSAQAMPFEKMLARKALRARLEKEMPKDVPLPWDESNLVAGAQIYREHCGVCHGFPGQEETVIAKGMYPRPPQLFRGRGVTDDPPGKIYWQVAGGIRMTGMPGFQQALSNTQLWQVSLLLANADKLPQTARTALSGQQTTATHPSNAPTK
jgi:mono/diheme cytochrome c family protein